MPILYTASELISSLGLYGLIVALLMNSRAGIVEHTCE